MKEPDLKKIRKAMEKELDPKRYEHTLGVAYTAASLAMCYGADLNSALIAGMLHDCAKCLSNEKKISICKKHDLPINPAEEKNPFLLHAKVGSYLASKKYGVTDPDILNAILNHTTGRPDMSLLEKIVWLSDYIEPGRKQAPNLPEIRRIAFENLDKALVMALENTLSYLKGGNMEIDSMTQKTYDFIKRRKRMTQAAKMTQLAIAALEDKKAEDITLIDIAKVSVLADYFLIANGNNRNQVQAMADNVDEQLTKAGYSLKSMEGYPTGNWILMDYGDLVVHVFDRQNRLFYDLERIWRDGEQIDVDAFLEEKCD